MDDDLQGYKDDDRWVAFAAEAPPVAPPERPRPRPTSREARGALALAILGLLGFGLVASPLALTLGRRARLASIASSDDRDAGVVHAALAMGKLGLALYLAIAISVIPWVLFVAPLMQGAGR